MAEQIAAISSVALDNMRLRSRPTDCLRIISDPPHSSFIFDEETAMLKAEKGQDDGSIQAELETYLKLTKSCYENIRRRLVHLLVCWEKLMLEKDTFDKNNQRLGDSLVTGMAAREFVTLYKIISKRAVVGCPRIPDSDVQAMTSGPPSLKRDRSDNTSGEDSKKPKGDA